jgi:hypothetical protein
MATASRPRIRSLSRLTLAGLCAVAAGCGGDDAPSDSEQIRAVVTRVMESADVKVQCETGVSERFVREAYVTLAHCRRARQAAAGADDLPDRAAVSATRIDGDRATTAVALTSPMGARARGRLALVKVGSTWRVDRFGIDFLRSALAALPAEAHDAGERLILRCLARATRTASDREVRRVGNLMVGRRLERESLPAGVVQCIRAGARHEQATRAERASGALGRGSRLPSSPRERSIAPRRAIGEGQHQPGCQQQHRAGDLQAEPGAGVRLRVFVGQGLRQPARAARVRQVDGKRDRQRGAAEHGQRQPGRARARQRRPCDRGRERGDDQQRVAVVGARGHAAPHDVQRADRDLEQRGELRHHQQRDGEDRERRRGASRRHETRQDAQGPLL